MSDDSLETQVANKIDKIVHTENFKDKYKVYYSSYAGILAVTDIQKNKLVFEIYGPLFESLNVISSDLREPLCFYNDIQKKDCDENTFLFEDPSNYEKIKNASWVLYSIACPEIKSSSSAWWLKTTPQIRRIYELWRKSNLDEEQDQYRIIRTIGALVASKNFQYTYNLKPWKISERKCSVYYKDFLCFCIHDHDMYDEMRIDVGCNCGSLVCENSPGTWWLSSPYHGAYNLYDKLAHLSSRQR